LDRHVGQFWKRGDKTLNDKRSGVLEWVTQALDYFGGARDEAPRGLPVTLGNWMFWALWWGAMAVAIYVCSGQSSKFIYIDF
jgi:hypothetical protein